MYLLLHVTLLVVEAFQLTGQTDLFTPSTTISVRHFQRKKKYCSMKFYKCIFLKSENVFFNPEAEKHIPNIW